MKLHKSAFILASLAVGLAGGSAVSAQDLAQNQIDPQANTLINAEIDVSMNITIAASTPVGSGDAVYCEATISVADPITGEWSRTANGVATLISATSYGCTAALKSQLLLPFGFTLGSPATDTVSITCSAYIAPSSGGSIKPYSQSGTFFPVVGGIAVPANGKKVPFSCPYAIRL